MLYYHVARTWKNPGGLIQEEEMYEQHHCEEAACALQAAEEQLPLLTERLGLDEETEGELRSLVTSSISQNAERFEESKKKPMVKALDVSIRLLKLLGTILIGSGSQMTGLKNLKSALDFTAKGGNVLLVSNHTSSADAILLNHVVSTLGGDMKNWFYVAGRSTGQSLLMLMVSGGFNRFQVHTAKDCRKAGEHYGTMHAQNAVTYAAIGSTVSQGGKCVVLYPEGTRNDSGTTRAEQGAMRIGQIMDICSPAGFKVLPSSVHAEGMLPVWRTPDEHEQIIARFQRANVSISFGQMVDWEVLNSGNGRLQRQSQTDMCMGLIEKCNTPQLGGYRELEVG